MDCGYKPVLYLLFLPTWLCTFCVQGSGLIVELAVDESFAKRHFHIVVGACGCFANHACTGLSHVLHIF